MTFSRNAVLPLATFVLTLGLVLPRTARSYERYNSGCQDCHGDFREDPYNSPKGGAPWPDSLHAVHRDSSYMNTACDLCHSDGDTSLDSSDGTGSTPGYGCIGCHGTELDGTLTGAGLLFLPDFL